MLSLVVIPANIAISDISLKTTFWATFLPQKVSVYLQPLCVMRSEIYQIRWNNANFGQLRRSRSSKVTDFGTNRKLICDLLLVIISNLPFYLAPFPRYSLESSKIAIFAYLVALTPRRRFPWNGLHKILPSCQWIAKVSNGVEILPKISIAWVGCTNVTDRQRRRTNRRTGDEI